MDRIRVTKIFHFEMAHALYGYNGPCKNIHGHSYELWVTVIGKPETQKESSCIGMVVDFGIIKAIVKECVIDKLDHSVMLNENAPYADLPEAGDLFQKKWIVPFQPTCENMLLDFCGKIKKELPPHVLLHSLKLRETPSSFAEWFEADQ